MVGPPSSQAAVLDNTEQELESFVSSVSATVDINAGLDPFQLVPKNAEGVAKIKGEDLLAHQISFRNQHVGAEPSPYLNLHIGDKQMEAINPTAADLA